MTLPWYKDENIFGARYKERHRKYVSNIQTHQEIQRILDIIGTRPKSILDIGCGHGRHVIPLAERGYDVTGIDLSLSLINQAKSSAILHGVTPTLKHMDMRDIKFKNKYDIALNLYTSFGYFNDSTDDLRVFKNMKNCLTSTGKVIIECFNMKKQLDFFTSLKEETLSGETHISYQHRIEKNVLYTQFHIKNPDNSIAVPAERTLQIYSFADIVELLTLAGFTKIKAFDGYSLLEADTVNSSRFLFIAE